MQLTCPHCRHTVEYASERPRFCSFCGQALSSFGPGASDLDVPTLTAAPMVDDSTVTRTGNGVQSGRVYQAGDSIGGYQLTRRIGAGAMGSVFEAEHSSSGQRVAVKLIAPDYAMSSAAVERFRLEGRLASTITHPRCVFVMAADEDAGQPFIVMELMPGTTLTTLVSEQGPLQPLDAIQKILDVIDGLQEAHRLGVIHRDVKPSNCFVDTRGRVKVGDFGLAKSVQEETDLTRSGTFVGTVLFASPEQIKRQRLDAQADVYSVCATLYYLLTGKPPFGGSDALAAATRIVTEDPPSMRSLRPDVPAALDRVVLRGLERDKGKRFADLEALRAALVRFLPGQLTFGGVGSRFVAYICDGIVLWLANLALAVPLRLLFSVDVPSGTLTQDVGPLVLASGLDMILRLVLWLAFYGVLEGVWGVSVGKLLMRLRVCRADAVESPGLLRALLRSLVSFSLINLGYLLGLLTLIAGYWGLGLRGDPIAFAGLIALVALLQLGGYVVGLALLCSTMRTSNGYRGLHEFASGTRVLELPPYRRKRRRFADVPFQLQLQQPEGMPSQLGRFQIEGAIYWSKEERTLVGHDPSLGRTTWITMRDRPETEAQRHRRKITRAARLRWVSSGQDSGHSWNAYLAPSGVPLPVLMAHEGRLPWADAAPIIEQLADELTYACADHSVPDCLSLYQVWVGENGRVQLVGTPLTGDASTVAAPSLPGGCPEADEANVVVLLRQAATCLLEGCPGRNKGPAAIQAPLPRFAAACLNGLFPGGYKTPREFRADLKKVLQKPAEVTHLRRFGHLAVLALLMLSSIGCLFMFGAVMPVISDLAEQIRYEELRRDFELTMKRDLGVAVLQPDPALQVAGVMRYEEDQRLLQELDLRNELVRQRRQVRRGSMMLPMRPTTPNQTLADPALARGRLRPQIRQEVRAALDRDVDPYPVLPMMQWISMLAGPAVWILWAFLARGALSMRFFGIDLVRANGNRASRWQCLLRAALFWAPLVALWAGSLLLDQYYWQHWYNAGFRERGVWIMWVSWAMWWGALLLLPVYFFYAVWKPQRSLHDRIVGTWLVPR